MYVIKEIDTHSRSVIFDMKRKKKKKDSDRSIFDSINRLSISVKINDAFISVKNNGSIEISIMHIYDAFRNERTCFSQHID